MSSSDEGVMPALELKSSTPAEVSMNYVPVLAIALAATIAAKPQPSSDEIAIRNIIQEEITAWNSGDAAAYSRHFAADGTFTNIRGQFFTGGDAFIERHDFIFKGPFHGSTLKQDVVWIQKLSPGTNTDDKGASPPTFVTGHSEGRRRMEDRRLPQHRCEIGRSGT
jgi:uncharacterized protein (TIGR02246 family)